MKNNFPKSNNGFSIVELLVVVAIIFIMASIAVYYLYAQQKLYRPDEQAAYLIDALQEARQRALTEKVTMRVEIDLTDNLIRLIHEQQPNNEFDDTVVRILTLRPSTEVRMDKRPDDISINPVEPSPVTPITYVNQSIHPLSLQNKVATLRFKKDGTVTDAGTVPSGANALVSGATIFIWQPKKDENDESYIARAITIIGGTGAIRLWNYHPQNETSKKWLDSRRFQ